MTPRRDPLHWNDHPRSGSQAIPPKSLPVDTQSAGGSRAGPPPAADRELERALGNQIRLIRRQHDLSISELATAASISVGMMSKIENGGISASLGTLQAISSALQVPLSSLFASFEQREDSSYVPAGKGVILERRGTKVGHVYELLGHLLRGEVAVEPYMITLRKNAVPYSNFSHSGVEFIYMLEGRLDYRHGSQVYSLNVGDSLLFDSRSLHGPEQLSGKVTRYLSVIMYPRSQA